MNLDHLQDLLDVLEEYLLPYQLKYLKDNSRRVIVLKSRRIGGSHVAVLRCLIHCLIHDGHQYTIVSTTASLSQTLLDIIRTFWIPIFQKVNFPLDITEDNKGQLTFGNGSKIVAKGSRVDALRGLTGSVLLDETAFLPNREQERLTTALFPLSEDDRNPHSELRIISTPWVADVKNTFFAIASNAGNEFGDFTKHVITVDDAVRQGHPFDLSRLDRMSPARADREYRCKFAADGIGSFWSRTRLQELIKDIPFHGPVTFGIDLGSKHDRTCIVGLDYQHKALGPTWNIEGLPYDEQFPIISNLIKEYNPRSVYVDATRNESFASFLRRDFGDIITPVHFTNPWKVRLTEDLDVRFSAKDLSIRTETYEWYESRWVPVGNPSLIDDLSGVKQKSTPSGLVTYDAPHDEHGHGDGFAASLLAWSSKGAQGNQIKTGSSKKSYKQSTHKLRI